MKARLASFVLLALLLAGSMLMLAESAPHSAGLRALEQAERLAATGQRTAAAHAYQQAIAQLPGEYEPALRLAELYYEWGHPGEGLNALSEAMRRNAPREQVITTQLGLLLQAGEYETAERVATARLERYPQDRLALATLATATLHRGDCEAAAPIVARWAAVAPADARAQRLHAALLPASLLPADDLARGLDLLQSGEGQPAICVLQRTVASDPTLAEAHAWLGETLSRNPSAGSGNGPSAGSGDGPSTGSGDARYHLEEATRLQPETPLYWLLLGTHALRQGDVELAETALWKAHTLDPGNAAACLGMAAAQALAGRYEATPRWIDATLERAPNDPEIWKAAARFYLERNFYQGDYPLRAATGAVRLAPSDPEAQLLLGWAQLLRGDAAGALAPLEAAGDFPQAHYLQGLALQTLGRGEEAQTAFLRAADLGYVEARR